MADYQAITQGIKSSLRGGARNPTDELNDLAAGYAGLCREANLRLRRCSEYMQLGCSAEARHLADCQPKLTQLVKALQFSESSAWNDTCVRLGLPLAPVLLTEHIDELQKALAAEQALRPLLARHRVLALAKSPIAERLSVVRLLVKHDGQSPCWIEEAQRLESVRLQEIQAAVVRAEKAGDVETLTQIYDELTTQTWQTEVSTELLETLQPLADERHRAAVTAEMTALATALMAPDALTGDATAARQRMNRWQELERDFPDALDAETNQTVRAVIQGSALSDQKRREMEESHLMQQMFRPTSERPPAKFGMFTGRKHWVVIALVLIAAAIGGFLYLRANPDKLESVKTFLGVR